MGPSLRWSSGIYATRWDTETPTGPHELSIFHDNLRIATTYDEADPAKWGGTDPPAPDGGAVDAGDPIELDAGSPAVDVEMAGTGGAGRGGPGGGGGSTG